MSKTQKVAKKEGMMAHERKNSVTTQGTLRDILTVLEKKIRNLEKRKCRLELVEKDLEEGKAINENQRLALSKKEQVLDMLEVCKDFHTTAEQLAKNDDAAAKTRAKKEQREAAQKTSETVGKVLRFQFLLAEALRREESEDDNQALEVLQKAIEEASVKDFNKATELWLNVLESKPKELAPGITFEAVHERLSSIGELLDKLNEVSLSMDAQEGTNQTEKEPALFPSGDGSVARGETPASAEWADADVGSSSFTGQDHQSPSPMDHVGVSQVDQAPLEQIDNGSATGVQQEEQQQHQQLHDSQLASHHTSPSVPAVHTHPAAVLSHQAGGHPVAGPAGHAPHPSHNVAVIPGIGFVATSPVQQQQQQQQTNPQQHQQTQVLQSDDGGDAIQFGSVDHSLHPAAIQADLHHHHHQQHPPTSPSAAHHHNGGMFAGPVPSPGGGAAAAPVAAAAAPPDPGAMFEDGEFDFIQDDLLHTSSGSAGIAGSAVAATTTAAAAATSNLTAPAVTAAALSLHADPAVVHVQATTTSGTTGPSLMAHAPLNAHYQQILQYQHVGPHQPQQQQQQQQQPPHLHPTSGHNQIQPQSQAEADNTQKPSASPLTTTSGVEAGKVDAHAPPTHQGHVNQHHQQQQQQQGHHNNNGHHHRHERDNSRRSPRDGNNIRGDHDGQQPHHNKGGNNNNNGYYRGMNGGAGGGGGHKNVHFGESNGRGSGNWSDNRGDRRGGDGNNRGSANAWGGRGGYNNGPRHHGGNNGGPGGGYGNRNGSGGMMPRREQTAQKV